MATKAQTVIRSKNITAINGLFQAAAEYLKENSYADTVNELNCIVAIVIYLRAKEGDTSISVADFTDVGVQSDPEKYKGTALEQNYDMITMGSTKVLHTWFMEKYFKQDTALEVGGSISGAVKSAMAAAEDQPEAKFKAESIPAFESAMTELTKSAKAANPVFDYLLDIEL